MPRLPLLTLCVVSAVFGTGCLERILLDGQLKATRKASTSFDTLTDLEAAKIGAGSSLVQLEGMYVLAPDQQDGLFLLLNGWTGYSSAFIEDEWEQAYDRGDDDAEAAQAERAKQAYDRAIHYGTELLEARKPGFVAACKDRDTLRAYLATFDKADAENLLWMGIAWMSRGGVAAERPEIVAELFVAEGLLERSIELDDSLGYGLALSALASYHARSPDAELKDSKVLFDRAIALTHRKALTTLVLYAQNLSCVSHDEKTYRALLEEVLAAKDPLPEQRLENVIAKRKAQRYLGAPRLKRCGF